MYLCYDGEISLNKPLDKEAITLLQNTKGITYECFKEAEEGDESFSVNEGNAGSWLDGEVETVIEKLSPLGYILNGDLDRWGDYDGMMYITNNQMQEYDDEDKWVVEASDEELANVLRERGYQVLPKRVAKDIVWDTDGEEVELPTEVLIPYDVPVDNEADYLSDTYGWCVISYSLKEVEI